MELDKRRTHPRSTARRNPTLPAPPATPSRDQRGCHKNDGVVCRVRQKWRGRRIRLDPQPGVDDAHHEDDADLETRDAGLRKVTEREYGGYRNTRNPRWMGNSFSKSQLHQAEEVPAKYGLLHERSEGDSDPGILPFERRAFVQGME